MRNIRGPRYLLRVNNPDAISGIDVLESVQSQYAASPRILALLVKKAALADPGRDVMAWYDGVFNPQTAVGIGLDIWGTIVGIGRKLRVLNDRFFGFSYSGLNPMDQAPFWSSADAEGQFPLSDEAYRFLIFYKAMANIGRGDVASLNAMLQLLFEEVHGESSCFVLEDGPMKIKAVFLFELTAYEQSLLASYGLLDRPAGVGFRWFQISPSATFGFAGQELQPFDRGVFTPFVEQSPAT
jgi:hypothetical protein